MGIYVRCDACDGTGDDGECEPCEGYGGFWIYLTGPGIQVRIEPGDADKKPEEPP